MATTTPARERTRREIEQQAMTLFVSRGYDATSLQDIATAAGCSKATVLYHFNGKPAVLAAVLEPSRIALNKLVTEAAGLPAAEAQEFTLTRFIDLAVEFRGLINVLQDLLPTIEQYPEFTELITDGIRMTELLAGGTDDQLEADLAKFAINGLLGECRHPGERTDAELHTLCDTALRRILRLTP
ncbi:TetR/AcrR family transcriptional regulator [Kribbella qitaiheensis]|uniref:TetR/AcrR family transcriptional regulator n=1 Tax=Kribbella qitaiheensis TaxID=1544730 RepID=A0A7G6X3F3_9ACTN|nr:TetR/AcrR family transcriptional regulator [Kribbella qitaiheensis]QNE20768.1 TetR/AcrR family transcriptional regulator [Kribbella qitaiheensis]